ncbi:MAG: hypothetical protein WCR54_08250 [Clostridia bacterium]
MSDPKIVLAFDGGINQSIDTQYLKTNEASEAQNCDLDMGDLSLCKGNSNYNNAKLGGTGNTIQSIFSYMDVSKSFYGKKGVVIVMDKTSKIYLLNEITGIFVKILDDSPGTVSDIVDFVNYQTDDNNITIYTNKTDKIKVIENLDVGSGIYINKVSSLKKDGKSSAASATNVAPNGNCIELYKERLWIAGGSLLNTIWFSTPYDPQDFTMPITEGEANNHGGFIVIPSWDNGKIEGIKGLYDDIVVFKTNNIFRIYGSDPTNFTVAQIADNVQGVIVNKTIKSHNTGILFTASDGIYTYDGVSIKMVSQRVQTLFKTMDKDAILDAVGVIFQNKYILAIRGTGSAYNNIVIEYDLLNNNFMVKSGFEVTDFLVHDSELLFVNRTNIVQKYNDEDVSTFNGSSIHAIWVTGDLVFGALDKKKKTESFHFVAKGNGSILITVLTEKKSKSKTIALTSSFLPYKVKLKNKGKVMNIKFENISGSSFTIKQTEVIYSV